ncbi:MAG: 3-hydroxyacyl-CoA dehydrogenase, partial [Actinomycetia bacterium]|nr:3-hydroxyacyl-CoA dehydrogenase [Actinomycetes bacterium]
MTENMIRWEQDSDGIVTLTMDDPNQGANTMNQTFQDSFAETVAKLVAEKENITGVILTSGKKTFFAGGDLDLLIQAQPADADRIADEVNSMKAELRKLETLGKPVVA